MNIKEEIIQLLVLATFLMIYMLLGAAIFSALESENEKTLMAKYHAIFRKFEVENNVTSVAMQKLIAVHQEACLLGVSPDDVQKWDYAGAFYFVGTVITTIGFGLTAPATFEGQLFFLFYAMIGIPLNILFLNTALERIVTAFSSFVRIGYNYIPKNKILTKPGPKEFPLVEVIIVAVVIFSIISFLIAIAFTFIEGWTFFESIYFIIVACSTVGFGDYVPSKTKSIAGTNHHDAYRVFNWFLICIGVVFIYVVLNLCANLFKNILRLCIEKSRKYVCPFINTRVEPADSKNASRRSAVNGRSGRISRASVDTEGGGLDIGSFAAIQSALDRLKLQAGEGSGATELKALSSIEDLLKKEYNRVQQRQGNTAKARWKRAAARVRSLSTSKPGILSPVMSSSINASQIASTQKMGNGTSSSINGSQIWTTHELRNSTSRLPATHDEENIPGAVN